MLLLGRLLGCYCFVPGVRGATARFIAVARGGPEETEGETRSRGATGSLGRASGGSPRLLKEESCQAIV